MIVSFRSSVDSLAPSPFEVVLQFIESLIVALWTFILNREPGVETLRVKKVRAEEFKRDVSFLQIFQANRTAIIHTPRFLLCEHILFISHEFIHLVLRHASRIDVVFD